MSILPYPIQTGATSGSGAEGKGNGEGMKVGAGGVIMSKLGNETAKCVFGLVCSCLFSC